jgi:hypothetical protein
VWTLDLDLEPTWSEFPRRHSVPSMRWDQATIFDPTRRRMVVFGGGILLGRWVAEDRWALSDETWALSLDDSPGWTLLEPDGPRPSGQGQVAIYDRMRDRMIVWSPCRSYTMFMWPDDCLDETWSLTFAGRPAWTRLETQGTPPDPYFPRSTAPDPEGRRMLVLRASGGPPSLYALQLEGPPVWTLLAASGDVPANSIQPVLFCDGRRGRMVMLDHEGSLRIIELLGDEARWHAVPGSAGTLTGVLAAAFDESSDRVIAITKGSYPAQQVWIFDLGTASGWARGLVESAGPPWREDCKAIVYDPNFDRVIVSGGASRGPDFGMLQGFSDTWALDLGPHIEEVSIDAVPRNPANTIPTGPRGVTPVAILGSGNFSPDSIEYTSLRFADAPVRYADDGGPMVSRWDVNGDGLTDLVVQIESDSMRLGPGDTFAVLRGSTPHARVVGFDRVRIVPATPSIALSAASPNPASGDVCLTLDLPVASATHVGVFDIAGRQVRILADGVLPAGLTPLVWDLAREDREPAAPGVYLVCARAGRATSTRKVVVLK